MNPEKKKVNMANRRRHRNTVGEYSPACAMRTKTTQPIAGLGAFGAESLRRPLFWLTRIYRFRSRMCIALPFFAPLRELQI